MSGWDIYYLLAGMVVLAIACLWNPSNRKAKEENVLHKKDFRWMAMVFLFMQIPWFGSQVYDRIQDGDVSKWGFLGVALLLATLGIGMGRWIEWGKQEGRNPPEETTLKSATN